MPLFSIMIAEISKQQNLTPSDRAEQTFLLYCIRYQFKTTPVARLTDLLETALDWEVLWQKAIEQNVCMIFYRVLKQIRLEAIPPSVLESIEADAQSRIAYNLFLMKTLLQVLDWLAKHDIEVLSFKGPVWAQLGYGNIGLRDFCDLDILVRPQDFSKAKEVLIDRGFYDKHSGSLEESIRQVQMVLPNRQINIDLHYNLVPEDFYLEVDPESFFENQQTLSFLGKTVATPSAENIIAIAYIHGAKEHWKSLKRICDFAALIQKYPEVNWQKVIAQCGTQENDRAFWLGVAIAQAYLQISLPEFPNQKLQQFPEVVQLARQHQYCFEEGLTADNRTVFRVLDLLKKKDMTLGEKTQYFLAIATGINTKDQERFSLPKFLFFLYYPLRIIRLLKTYGLSREKLGLLLNLFKH